MLSNRYLLLAASSLLLATSSAQLHEVVAHRGRGYNSLQSHASSSTDQFKLLDFDLPTDVLQTNSSPAAVRSSSPSVDQTSSPSVGQTSSPSVGQTSSPSVGHSSSPSVGQSSSPSVGQSSSPSIGQISSPSVGQTSSPSVGQTSSLTVGQSSSPSVGQSSSPTRIQSNLSNGRCEMPTITPSKGTYAGSVLVSFSTPTKGAKICFNINSHLVPSATEGDCVSNGDSIELSQTGALNIQAVALLDGLEDSAVLKTTITILAKAKAPSITPDDTVFTTSATLTFATATVGPSTIYYTDNEDVPTTSSLTIENGGQLIIDRPGEHTIRCIVVADGMEASDVVTRHISILERTKQPAMDPQSGHFIGNVNVKFPCSDEDRGSSIAIYYTTDGKSTPSQQSSRHVQCGEDISLKAPGSYLVRAFSIANGKSQSAMIQGTFVLTRSPLDKYKVSRVQGRFQVQPEVELIVVEKDLEYSYQCPKRSVRGRLVILHNPSGHFEVLPPLTGCSSGKLEFPSVSGKNYQSSAFNLTDYVVRDDDAVQTDSISSIVIDTSKIEKRLLPWYIDSLLTDTNDDDTLVSGKRADHLKTIDLSMLRDLQAQYNSVQSLGCQVVTNAGFFNVTSGTCTGNLISGGVIHQLTDKHNVNFGMRDGEFYIGYLSRDEITDPSLPAFDFLISGLGWLVRGGRSYIDESLSTLEDAENMSVQSNGAAVFKTLKSARTAIGHDEEGNLMLLQVEGESFVRGMDLNEFADFAVELGFVSAVNLDGGGSATMTQNHSLISEPSWTCVDPPYKNHRYYHCEKRVSSITCIHAMAPPFVEQSVLPVNVSASSSTHGHASISFAELGVLQNQLYLFQLSTGILSTVLAFLLIAQFACCLSSCCRSGTKSLPPISSTQTIDRTTTSGGQYIEIDIEKNAAVIPSTTSPSFNQTPSSSKKAVSRDMDSVLNWKPPADDDDDFYNDDDDDDHTGLLVHQKKSEDLYCHPFHASHNIVMMRYPTHYRTVGGKDKAPSHMLPPVQEDEEEDDDPYSEEHASKPLLSSSSKQQQQSSNGKVASTHSKLKSSNSSAYSIAVDTSMDTASSVSSKPLRTKLKKTSKRSSTP